MIRLFTALAIPDDIAAALDRRQDGLEGARWRPREALHVTLKFYGEIREDVARDLDTELLSVGSGPFEIALEGVGAFSDRGEPTVLWAGLAPNRDLKRLARDCEIAARRVGLNPEGRRFHPHLTLAYLRGADPAKVAGWIQANNLLKSPPIPVDRFGLYSSVLGREGASYRLEAEYPLKP